MVKIIVSSNNENGSKSKLSFLIEMSNAVIYIYITRILSDNVVGARLIALDKLPYSAHGFDTIKLRFPCKLLLTG